MIMKKSGDLSNLPGQRAEAGQTLADLRARPKGKRVLVVGGGRSGQGAARFLHGLGATVSVSDSAPPAQLDQGFANWLRREKIFYEGGGHNPATFVNQDLIVVSPGVPLTMEELVEAAANGVAVVGELGLAALWLDLPVIAVTGTNGKTTVTSLIGDFFKAAGCRVFVGGNIGVPLTDYLLTGERADLAVLEVSSFQLDTAGSFRPRLAVLLNISPDHLDRYSSYGAYGDAKMAIFANQQDGDIALVNGEDPEVMGRLALLTKQQIAVFGRRDDTVPTSFWQDGAVVLALQGNGRQVESYSLPGHLACSPNRENCQAAIIAARLMACPEAAIVKGLADFVLPAHRLRKVAEIDRVVYYDDSKATNIGALQAALAGMTRPVILLAGGRDKGGDYKVLADLVRTKVKKLLLFGEARDLMVSALGSAASVELVTDMAEAVSRAAELSEPGDAVLLSPACASFDMFNDYGERGDEFCRQVDRLKG